MEAIVNGRGKQLGYRWSLSTDGLVVEVRTRRREPSFRVLQGRRAVSTLSLAEVWGWRSDLRNHVEPIVLPDRKSIVFALSVKQVGTDRVVALASEVNAVLWHVVTAEGVTALGSGRIFGLDPYFASCFKTSRLRSVLTALDKLYQVKVLHKPAQLRFQLVAKPRQVCVSVGEESHEVMIQPLDCVEKLYDKLKTHIYPDGSFYLEGMELDDQSLIAELDLSQERIIEWRNPPFEIHFEGSGPSFLADLRTGTLPFAFADLDLSNEEEEELEVSPPVWRRIRSGLNMRGVCVNKTCEAFEEDIWKPLNFGTFRLSSLIHNVKCPCCDKVVQWVKTCGLHNCLYLIEAGTEDGEYIDPDKRRASAGGLVTFDATNMESWRFAELRVKRVPPEWDDENEWTPGVVRVRRGKRSRDEEDVK